LIRLLKKT